MVVADEPVGDKLVEAGSSAASLPPRIQDIDVEVRHSLTVHRVLLLIILVHIALGTHVAA